MRTAPTPFQPDADNLILIRGMPIKERITWLMHRAYSHSTAFQSPESVLARNLYTAQHQTAIVTLKCMDGRLDLSVATSTPAGIVQPFRNLGGRFKLGWLYFGEVLADHVRDMVEQGRRTLALITYHYYSKGDPHRGCAGFNYNTDAARNHTFEIKRQMEAVFGKVHSGVGRRLEANSWGPTNPTTGAQPSLSSQTYVTGWGVSTSLFLPVLPSKNGEIGNTAHVVMEGVTGAGIADFFNGLSWGVCNPTCGFANTSSGFGGSTFGQTNIDYGLGAVSSQTGKFEAIRTVSMMVHGTYYLPDNGKTWVGGGYGTVYSSNASQMTCTGTGATAASCGGATRSLNSIYDRESTYYGYLYHDFTQEIRMGLETNFTRTSYANNSYAENRRVMLSLYWRF